MRDNDDGEAGIGRQSAKKTGQRLDATGGGANPDNRKSRMIHLRSISISICGIMVPRVRKLPPPGFPATSQGMLCGNRVQATDASEPERQAPGGTILTPKRLWREGV